MTQINLNNQFRFDIKTRGIDYALDRINNRMDRLIKRLKNGTITDDDAVLLAEYMEAAREADKSRAK